MKRFIRKFIVAPILFLATAHAILLFEFLEWMFTKEEDRWYLWNSYIKLLFGDSEEDRQVAPSKRLPTAKDLAAVREILIQNPDELVQDSLITAYLEKNNITSVGIGRVDGVRFTTLRA